MKWTQRLLLPLVVGSLVAITLGGMDDGTLEARSMRVVAGTGEAGFEDGSPGKFNKPIRLAPYGEGAVLVADIFNHAIRVVTVDGEVRTISGAPDRKGYEDGSASAARFASPHGIAVGPDGLLSIAEMGTHRVLAIDRGGRVTPICGTAEAGSGPDRLNRPAAVLMHDGDLWVADLDNHRIVICQAAGATARP